MRKNMTKEVTKTTAQVAKIAKDENGKPEMVPMDDVILLGNVSLDKAQKEVNKRFDEVVTVFGVQAETTVYTMPVEKFIQLADVKTDEDEKESEEAPKDVQFNGKPVKGKK